MPHLKPLLLRWIPYGSGTVLIGNNLMHIGTASIATYLVTMRWGEGYTVMKSVKGVREKLGRHALLSASSSHRWLACPPSARLREDHEDTGSKYALILSRSVDTFSSRILYPMLLLSGDHSIAVV